MRRYPRLGGLLSRRRRPWSPVLKAFWKDCNHKHDQAVANVRRLRAALGVAEEKEQLAARSLASAEIGKKQAAQALAKAAGLTPSAEGGPTPAFEVKWDGSLFDDLDQVDVEESERVQLRNIKAELEKTKTTLEAKNSEVQGWLDKAAQVKSEISARAAKKRRAADGQAQAVPEAAPPF